MIGLVFLAILATVLAVIVLGGGDGGVAAGSTSPSASGSVGASEPPSSSRTAPAGESGSPSGSAAPTAPPADPVIATPAGIVPPGSLVEVTAEGLRIREQPSTSAAVVATVPVNEVVYVRHEVGMGPINAEGFDWYPVFYAPGWRDWPMSPPEEHIHGFLAAGSPAESFVTPLLPRCRQGQPDLVVLYRLTEWERLACYGNRQITFTGTYGCGGCGGLNPGTYEPAWLTHPIDFNIIVPDAAQPHGTTSAFLMRVPPEMQAIAGNEGSILRVTGHFDDSRAVGCVVAPGEPGSERPAFAAAAELYCREQFVVESWEVIGTDPAWQGS